MCKRILLSNILETIRTVIFRSSIKTVFLAFIISIQLVTKVNGQNYPDPNVSFNVVNIPLSRVLKILEQKTNYTFSYLNEKLPLDESVTMNVKDKPLQQILKILSNNFALMFTRINNIITVKMKEEAEEDKKSGGIGTLRGIVRDSITTEVLPFANVYIPELKTGVSTDNRGFFIIPSIPANKGYTLVVTFVGYSPKKITLSIQANKITHVDVYLAKSTVEIENVVVSGEKVNVKEVTGQKISIQQIESMPQGIETDVMRSIQYLPGVQSGGDVSANYYVRGGASNENLVLLNGTPIYNPFHALGIFSVIDPDMINGIEFYKGGFGARYGGRLSSVMDIITKDGNRNNYAVTAAISQLTAKTALEGPIPNGSFIITGRKSYSSQILKKFTNNKSIPIDFYDASFRVNYNYYEHPAITKFTLFGFTSKDKINYKDKIHSNFNWSNSHIGINLFSAVKNSPLFAEFTFYFSEFYGGEIPISGNTRQIENGVYDFTIKGDFSYTLGDRNEFYGGVKTTDLKTKLLLSNSGGVSKDVGSKGFSLNSYVGFKLNSVNDLKVDLGTRLNIMKLVKGPALFFEPRINAIYSLFRTLNVKAAWGIYQQELVTISDEDEILALFEPWIITPEYLKSSNSIHYIAGLDYYFTDNCKINLEGYYKVMHNLAVLNDEVVYPTDPQLINGSGWSHGTEISMNYHNYWINAQLSYAYSNTTKKVREIEYHPRYDSRHTVKILINFELGNNWTAGISWNYNSGMPFTQILGYYNKFDPSEVFSSPSFDNYYEYFPILANRNAARLPDYHKLDVSLSKKFQLGIIDMSIDLNLINIYDRKNFFYFDMETGERVNMLPFFPTIAVKVKL